jgi:hypothetical protein
MRTMTMSLDRPLIDLLYLDRLRGHDLSAHMEDLYALARECNTVTEFGTRSGNSLAAFMAARPDRITCYDLDFSKLQKYLFNAAAKELGVELRLIEQDTNLVDIEITDLLLLDSRHTKEQVANELKNAERVQKFIALHDTLRYGGKGENGASGILEALDAFLNGPGQDWEIKDIDTRQNGLTVLKRRA